MAEVKSTTISELPTDLPPNVNLKYEVAYCCMGLKLSSSDSPHACRKYRRRHPCYKRQRVDDDKAISECCCYYKDQPEDNYNDEQYIPPTGTFYEFGSEGYGEGACNEQSRPDGGVQVMSGRVDNNYRYVLKNEIYDYGVNPNIYRERLPVFSNRTGIPTENPSNNLLKNCLFNFSTMWKVIRPKDEQLNADFSSPNRKLFPKRETIVKLKKSIRQFGNDIYFDLDPTRRPWLKSPTNSKRVIWNNWVDPENERHGILLADHNQPQPSLKIPPVPVYLVPGYEDLHSQVPSLNELEGETQQKERYNKFSSCRSNVLSTSGFLNDSFLGTSHTENNLTGDDQEDILSRMSLVVHESRSKLYQHPSFMSRFGEEADSSSKGFIQVFGPLADTTRPPSCPSATPEICLKKKIDNSNTLEIFIGTSKFDDKVDPPCGLKKKTGCLDLRQLGFGRSDVEKPLPLDFHKTDFRRKIPKVPSNESKVNTLSADSSCSREWSSHSTANNSQSSGSAPKISSSSEESESNSHCSRTSSSSSRSSKIRDNKNSNVIQSCFKTPEPLNDYNSRNLGLKRKVRSTNLNQSSGATNEMDSCSTCLQGDSRIFRPFENKSLETFCYMNPRII